MKKLTIILITTFYVLSQNVFADINAGESKTRNSPYHLASAIIPPQNTCKNCTVSLNKRSNAYFNYFREIK